MAEADRDPGFSCTPLPGRGLAHLDGDQVATLMARYYSGEPIQSLIDEYGISARPSGLVGLFPAELLDRTCPYCGQRLVRKRSSRDVRWLRAAACPRCRHADHGGCRCRGCNGLQRQQKREHEAAVRASIEAYCRIRNAKLATPELAEAIGPVATIALYALMRTCPWGNEDTIPALGITSLPFTPAESLSKLLLDFLHDEGLIGIDPTSHPAAFTLHGTTVLSHSVASVSWVLPKATAGCIERSIERVVGWTELPAAWQSEAENVQTLLSVAECEGYFGWCLADRGLPAPDLTSMREVIAELLRGFSVAQAFRIIWNGAKEASDFLMRTSATRAQASHHALAACRRWGEQARSRGWTIYPFSRPKELPRSMLSMVLHDVVMKVGERGAHMAGLAGSRGTARI